MILILGVICAIWVPVSIWFGTGAFLYRVVNLYLVMGMAGVCTVAGMAGVLSHVMRKWIHPGAAMKAIIGVVAVFAALLTGLILAAAADMAPFVVVVVMGTLTLAAWVGSLMFKPGQNPQVMAAEDESSNLAVALGAFLGDVGRYPTTQEGLDALIRQPPSVERWHGPYFHRQEIPLYLSKHRFVYRYPGERTRASYDLYSVRPKGLIAAIVLLVVIVTVPLAAWVGSLTFMPGPDPRFLAAKNEIATLASALDAFSGDVGRYPTTQEGLNALVQQPSGLQGWRGPYLHGQGIPLDPWKHPYLYRCPGKHNTGSYDLYSVAWDGQKDTNDDIGNWPRE